jgi:DNA repair ATPase RecN
MEHLPEIVLGLFVGTIGWFIKDKMAGVKEIDQKLSDKIDKLLEMVFELKAAIKGIDDLTNRMSRAEHRLERLEALNRNGM